jgi:hypothetical protein
MAVIPGRLAVPRMQTFAQAWWWLLRCLLRVESGHPVRQGGSEFKTFGHSTRLNQIKGLRFPKHTTEIDRESCQVGVRLPQSRENPCRRQVRSGSIPAVAAAVALPPLGVDGCRWQFP